ncbi:ABC transporter substrate-binding protein [Stutzerimonas xanthomarina]|uniref:ABC transporter substrate-binding protein n=1 Tax=Stutzerimonas xanthomarina TaxID=271420 RepID=UPI0029A76AF1|nr:ABC transporter substrate-binding protein [Stutzerimonas xanthomarina]MDX2354644.1 ABC transporter substrate-binding protein [Stutzerimonas xanthomarina]
MKRLMTWILAVSLTCVGSLQASESPQCEVVRFADVGWTDVTMTTAVTRLLLGELGYRTQVSRLSLPETYAALAGGKIDVFLGSWMPAQAALAQPHLDTGRIEKLQTNLPVVRYTLAVLEPAYKAGLHDFADIQRFQKELGGKIYGLERGNGGNKMVQSMIDGNVFGLQDFTLVESSENDMLNHVELAQRLGKSAVFLGWEPHPMNEQLRMSYLSGGDAYFGPNNGAAEVSTVARGGFSKDCQNLNQLFTNMTFTIASVSKLMAAVQEPNTNRRRVAKQWIKDSPGAVANWLKGVSFREGGAITAILGTPLASAN